MNHRRRSKTLPQETLRRMFLRAVYHHPWSSLDLAIGYGGLTKTEARTQSARALSEGLVEQVTMRSTKHKTSRRYAVTEAGADYLNEPRLERAFLQDALLRSHQLDTARFLMKWWAKDYSLPWSLSPFGVQASDMKQLAPETTKSPFEMETPDMWQRLRALRLAGAGCVQLEDRYVNFVILVDPGEIMLSWFFNQFHNFHRWGERPEFRNRKASFPVFILLAANQTRLEQLIYLWRAAAIWRKQPEHLLATTRWAAMNNPEGAIWWNETYRRVTMWSGAPGDSEASPCPDRLPACDPDHRQAFLGRGEFPPEDFSAPSRRSVVGGSAALKTLFRCCQKLTPATQTVLETIGRYPLLKQNELALLLGVSKPFISQCLKSLRPLIDQVEDIGGLSLSPLGLRLLAGQAGFKPAIYTQLRRWPATLAAGPGRTKEVTLSLEHLLKRRDHARISLDFMIGLYRAARRSAVLRMISWDQECLYIFKNRKSPLPLPGKEASHRRVVPDAVGAVCVTPGGGFSLAPARPCANLMFAPGGSAALHTSLTTEFWLEIDRGQLRGSRFRRKLDQYYRARGGLAGIIGWLPRLLIVVEENDEQRAQTIARRIRELDQLYGRALDVLITRRDLLRDREGYLDPTFKVWRRPQDWATLTYAFNGLPVVTVEISGAARLRARATRQRKRDKPSRRKTR